MSATRATALITGVGGQDGILLARHLRAAGYRVVGTRRAAASPLDVYLDGIEIRQHDLTDPDGFAALIAEVAPTEVYNLAGLSSVAQCWQQPELAEHVNAIAVERMLDVLTALPAARRPRFFQASSAEIFGPDISGRQNEDTPWDPRGPYAESKARAHRAVIAAREAGELAAAVGILYPHESPVRGAQFVTRKITRTAAEIAEGRTESLTLGATGIARDWSSAAEMVRAFPLMLAREEPRDYVLASGVLHTIRDLVEFAFAAVGIDDPWPLVQHDPSLVRTVDAPAPCGDASRAAADLGWRSTRPLADVIDEMVQIDRRRLLTGIAEDPAYVR